MASVIPFLFLCLLLAPHLGSSSYHTSYIVGGNKLVVRRSGSADGPSRTTTSACSSTPSAGHDDGALPVVHRLSPCSPLGASLSQAGKPSAGDVLHRDAQRLQSLFGPATKTDSGVTVNATGTPLVAYPGASDYHVIVGYGTPVQKLTVGFDTVTTGVTVLQCKPCTAGAPCDHAFGPSQSSSIAQLPCGSRDCPFRNECSGPSCTFSVSINGTLHNGTVVTDTLTLSPSTTVQGFRSMCSEMGAGTSGMLDLSGDSHSLVSRLAPSSPDTVAFSYCLPLVTAATGFLSIGPPRPARSSGVSYTPLQRNIFFPNLYFVRLVAISVAGRDIPAPPAEITGAALMELQTTFTHLRPKAYAALRGAFVWEMSGYRRAPPEGELDTCYDFTGQDEVVFPVINLKFDGGGVLSLEVEQMMYFRDGNCYSVGCLAFAAAATPGVAVIGTLAQTNTEVVYDVARGKVGFVQERCGFT